jgi:putative endonuclease
MRTHAAAEPPAPYRSRPPAAIGRLGEEAAERLLRAHGFRVLERRYRIRGGEVDLIAREGETLVFVEVKTRGSLVCGRPAEAVGAGQRRRILRAAAFYLAARGGPDRPCRFDVVEVLREPSGRLRTALIRDAFQGD